MDGKSSELNPPGSREPLATDAFPLRSIEGQLVIVGVTPAVAHLARVARAMRQERRTIETANTDAPDLGGAPR
jgi:hypothetical protein